MSILRVEELEQRHLLSGGLLHTATPVPLDRSGAMAWTLPSTGTAPVNSRDCPGHSDPGAGQFGSFENQNLGSLEGVVQVPIVSFARNQVVPLPTNNPEGPDAGHGGARQNSLSFIPAVREPSADHGSNVPMVEARASPFQSPALVGALASIPSAIELSTTSALSFGQKKVRSQEVFLAPPIVPPSNRTPGPPASAASASRRSEAGGGKPDSPIRPSLVSIVSAVDVARLTRGFNEFLESVERTAERVAESDGLRPWIVAGAAAAVACELARRQLRRHAAATQPQFELARITVSSE
jgi:hypothetical protein